MSEHRRAMLERMLRDKLDQLEAQVSAETAPGAELVTIHYVRQTIAAIRSIRDELRELDR
jgi:hypothetical protein